MRSSGFAKGTPCSPSTTCGPLAPSPSRKRLPLIAASVSAVIAVIDGARALICMIPVPSPMRDVRAARNASGVTASWPHASADHATSTPSFSASHTKSIARPQALASAPLAGPPKPIATFISGRRVEEALEAVLRVRADRDLLEHAHADVVAAARPHDLLDVLVLRRVLVQVGGLPRLAGLRVLALPLAVAPDRVLVADALHAEGEQRLQHDLVLLPVDLDLGDRGALRAARAGRVLDLVIDVEERHLPRVVDERDLLRVVVHRHDHPVPVPAHAGVVLEDARVRA